MHPPSVAAEPGETFTVDIKVANVKNLYTYQFYLSWEPRLLNLTRITEGPFLNSEKTYKTSFNPRVYNTPDPFNVSGYVYVACTLLGEPATAAANGDGTLATIEFLVKEEGKTLLHLYKTKLLSHMMNEMPHVTEDGEYHFMYPTDIEINVQPLTIIDSSLLPGKDFDIDINIVKALDIYAWSLNLKWDPKLLSVSDIKEGSFLNQGYYKTNFTIHIDAEKGILYADCSLFEEPPESSASGNGTLMSITFHVKALGITVLDLYDTKIIGYGGIEVSHTTKDGYFKNLAGVEYPSAFAVSVQPSDIVNASLLPDSTFSINISIIQAVDIYAWSLKIKWDPVLLSVIDVKEGPFLNQGSYNTTFTYLDQEEGILYADCSLFEEPPESSASGNGTLMS
ncbi:MAG: cohesin domain-containing protein, partial [Candidatus Bathyarchaeia archaeon]